MKKQTIFLFAAALVASSASLRAQMVQIDFTAVVHDIVGTAPAGVSLGSSVTGHVTVDLQYLSPECQTGAVNFTCFDYTGGRPGYVFQLDTGAEKLTWDSAVAASGVGTVPGIFFYDLSFIGLQFINVEARNAGEITSVNLRIQDTNAPAGLFTGARFPDSINLQEVTDAAFYYYGPIVAGDEIQFRADVTSLSLTVTPARSPCELLVDALNGANLASQVRKPLLTMAQNACRAMARGDCGAASHELEALQKLLQARLARENAALAGQLSGAAQAIINSGCSGK
jgi:hypothetical protein